MCHLRPWWAVANFWHSSLNLQPFSILQLWLWPSGYSSYMITNHMGIKETSLIWQGWLWSACSNRKAENQRCDPESEDEELLAGNGCLNTMLYLALLNFSMNWKLQLKICREVCAWPLLMRFCVGSMGRSKRVGFWTCYHFFYFCFTSFCCRLTSKVLATDEDYILQFAHPFNRLELLQASSCPDSIAKHVLELGTQQWSFSYKHTTVNVVSKIRWWEDGCKL